MSFLDVAGRDFEELVKNANVIHMGHNSNQLPLHNSIKKAMIKSIEAEEFRNYCPPYGLKELRNLVRDDLGVPNLEVLVTQGSTEAIFQAMFVFFQEPGYEMIITDPAWPHIENFARSLGASIVEVPIYDRAIGFKITADQIKKHLSDKTRLISIIDPLNPLGTAYTEEEIKQFCRLAEESGAYLLHDATYREFAGDEHYPAPRYYDKAVSAVSLSKCSGFSGLRFGALLAHPSLFEKIADNQISRLGASWVTQRGAAAAYASKKEWIPELLKMNLAHQRLIYEAIDNVQGMDAIAFPSKGNFLAIDVTNTKKEADEIVKKVLDAGIVTRSGGYTSKLFGNRFIRITTTVPREHVLRVCDVLTKVL